MWNRVKYKKNTCPTRKTTHSEKMFPTTNEDHAREAIVNWSYHTQPRTHAKTGRKTPPYSFVFSKKTPTKDKILQYATDTHPYERLPHAKLGHFCHFFVIGRTQKRHRSSDTPITRSPPHRELQHSHAQKTKKTARARPPYNMSYLSMRECHSVGKRHTRRLKTPAERSGCT